MLESSFWVSGVLKDTFVSKIPALLSLTVYQQWSRFLQLRTRFGLQLFAFSRCFTFLKYFY